MKLILHNVICNIYIYYFNWTLINKQCKIFQLITFQTLFTTPSVIRKIAHTKLSQPTDESISSLLSSFVVSTINNLNIFHIHAFNSIVFRDFYTLSALVIIDSGKQQQQYFCWFPHQTWNIQAIFFQYSIPPKGYNG